MHVSTGQGWLYVAFVIDVYARRVVGWRVSSSMRIDFELDALEQALYAKQPHGDGSLECHSDRGSQLKQLATEPGAIQTRSHGRPRVTCRVRLSAG